MKFQAHTCEGCGQTKDYALPLSRGLAMATIAFYNAVERLGRNRIHVAKEMVRPIEDFWGENPKNAYHRMVEEGYMTFRMEGNLSFLHRHGIVASGDEPGVWILTKKGGAFLRGDEVPRVAIVSKVSGHQIGYWDEGGMTTISQLLKASTVWWDAPATVTETNETIPMTLVTV